MGCDPDGGILRTKAFEQEVIVKGSLALSTSMRVEVDG